MKGFAMSHAIHRVDSVNVVGPHTLDVTFEDGTRQVIDLGPVLAGPLFGPLRDPELFKRVRIDPEIHTLVWPNGADFDPATLHDWPDYADELTKRAANWDLQPASP
jgi:uncharacterized protein DUF2442